MFRKRYSSIAEEPIAEELVYPTQPHHEAGGAAGFIETELPPDPSATAPSTQAPRPRRQQARPPQPAQAVNPGIEEVAGNEFYLTQRLLGFVGGGAIAHMIGVNSGLVAVMGFLPNGVGIVALALLLIGQKSRRWGIRNAGIEMLIALMLISLISGLSLTLRGVVKELITPPTPSIEQTPSP
jgi:hypothetical protein